MQKCMHVTMSWPSTISHSKQSKLSKCNTKQQQRKKKRKSHFQWYKSVTNSVLFSQIEFTSHLDFIIMKPIQILIHNLATEFMKSEKLVELCARRKSAPARF